MTKKLLVVDDEPNIVRGIKERFEFNHFDVISAHDGVQGLKKAQEEKPDVIILDLIMPKMDGFEVCKKLKENPITRKIPVIIITAAGIEDIARDEPGIEAEAYIAKPYDSKKLVEAVHNAIERCLKK